MITVLITGADDFIGRSLWERLDPTVYRVKILVRQMRDDTPLHVVQVVEGSKGQSYLPNGALSDVDVLLHMDNGDHINAADIAHKAAQAARAAQVKRVVIKSSVAAQIAQTDPSAARAYGQQKAAADDVFRQILNPDQSVVFLRPPAVYGPGAAGPLAALSGFVRRGLFLPLGGAQTKRPYIAIDNFCDLIETLLKATDAQWQALSGKALVCRDARLISTADLVREMAAQMGRPARLFAVPSFALRLLGTVTGKQVLIQGVLDLVPCDPSPELQDVLGWSPAHTMPQSLAYLESD